MSSSSHRIPVAAIAIACLALGFAFREVAARRRVGSGLPFARIRRSVSIGAPAETAYGLLVDAEAMGRLSPDVNASAHSPNRWHWDFALPAGLSATVETVMTDARPGRRLALRSVHGSSIPFEAEFDLFPAADSGETIVTAVVTFGAPRVLPATLVERPLRRAADRAIAGLLTGLRSTLEAGTPQPGSRRPAQASDGSGNERGPGRVVYGELAGLVAAEPDPSAGADAAIDEALEESFPASDAPGFAMGTSVSPEQEIPAISEA